MEKKFMPDENHIVCNTCGSVYSAEKENHVCSLVRGEPGIPKTPDYCPHCNGYGSSFKDPIGVDRCTKCHGTGLKDR